jgi:endoglucanase
MAEISRREALGGIAALTVPSPRFAAASPPPVYPRLARGVNLHHLLNWPEAREVGDALVYAWPPFTSPRFALGDDELRALTRMGFDFVRLTVDPAILIATPRAGQALLRDHIDEVVTRLLAAGLNVIVDLHPVAQNPLYPPAAWVEAASPDRFDVYLALVERIAGWLAARPPDRLALELMNEPRLIADAEAPRWRGMLDALHRRARAAAARLPLVLNGIAWDGAAALSWLDPATFAGDSVLYTFHYYEPHTFTHQGAENDTTRFISGLRWPADPANVASVESEALARIAAAPLSPDKSAWFAMRARQLLKAYARDPSGAEVVADVFGSVADWAAGQGISSGQVVLGEFGCVATSNGAPLDASRTRWLRAVRAEAERRGFPWAYWAYKGHGGMALIDADGRPDPATVAALGMTPP